MSAVRSYVIVAALGGLVGCSFEHGALSSETDAAPTTPDGSSSCVSFASQIDTCGLASDSDLTLSGTNTYDTSAGRLLAGTTQVPVTEMQIQGKAGPIDLIVVHDFRITANARLKVVGNVPFGIIAFGSITLETGAAIDASEGGAGARTTCAAGAMAGEKNSGGAGGGGGGGFGGVGGTGGMGNLDGTHAAGGPGGVAVAKPAGPLGGCPGAKGGDGDDSGGNAGTAGGALYFAAATRIDIAAQSSINVAGGGGQGGRIGGVLSNGDAGGGGGGSGGMIWIESPVVRADGTLAANGGGGGEASGGGSSGNNGTTGFASVSSAPGGNGHSDTGTDGGAGGALGMSNGVTVSDLQNGGGGGGGGGVGFILVMSPSAVMAVASPTPIVAASF